MEKGRLVIAFLVLSLVSVGFTSQSALADAGQGILYATSPQLQELWKIDPSNGDSTFIGETFDAANENSVKLQSLEVDPSTGTMYAGSGSCDDKLYTVDHSNGELTLIGDASEGTLVGL